MNQAGHVTALAIEGTHHLFVPNLVCSNDILRLLTTIACFS